jgi:hypothetical protein
MCVLVLRKEKEAAKAAADAAKATAELAKAAADAAKTAVSGGLHEPGRG